jgi:hypothetical protein
MEMMDLKTAIRLFDHYASMLDWQQRLLQRTRSLAKSDPELAELAIAPPVTGSAGVGIASADSAATIAETKPVLARQPHSCLARNKRW